MAFITGQTNRRLNRREPADYLAEIVRTQGVATLSAQRVPAELDKLQVAQYRDFLAGRRAALAACMNAFIETKAGAENEFAIQLPDA